MTSSLAQLTVQLQADVPALNGAPGPDAYRQAVIDAIADLSVRQPRPAVATLTIVSGQAVYDLPADCVRLIRLAGIPGLGGTLILDEGLVPTQGLLPLAAQILPGATMTELTLLGWMRAEETATVAGTTLTLTPTPALTTDRALHYAAGDVLSEDGDSYATLDARRAQIAMRKARAIALQLQASVAARDAWSSELGPEKVDKTKQADALRAAAAQWEAQYQQAIAQAIGPYGSRS